MKFPKPRRRDPGPKPTYNEYRKRRKAFLRKRRYCEAWGLLPNKRDERCYWNIACVATQVHHMRGRDGDLLIDQRYWRAVGHPCHRYLHDHPEEAQEAGLLLPRHDPPDEGVSD